MGTGRTVTQTELMLGDGRVLHVYDTAEDARLTVFWHHGTPNTGEPPEPLFPAAARHGIRWVSYDRPSYGTSTPVPGRDVASAAADVASIADALGIERFAVMGHSGGGPHALACGALLPDRVLAVVSGSSLAPYTEEFDWFAGMYPGGVAELSAARAGRAELERYFEAAEFDPEMFTQADQAALDGEWSWVARVAGQAIEQGPGGMIDDNLAFVAPWGFSVRDITVPVLILHGGRDRIVPSSHGEWLASHIGRAELWRRPEDGHVSVLGAGPAALDWLAGHASGARA
jgi:pimeloyl-ACP methyl ester carboxylesterase